MLLQDEDLFIIASNSLSLEEIIKDKYFLKKTKQKILNDEIDEIITKWKKSIGDTDGSKFDSRLKFDGLNINKIYNILNNKKNTKCNLPAWINIFKEIICFIDSNHFKTVEKIKKNEILFLDKNHAVPFEDFFIHFVLYADEKFKKLSGSLFGLLSDNSVVSLMHNLLVVLSAIGSKVLEMEFTYYKWDKQSILDKMTESANSTDRLYTDFVDELLTGGIIKFFKEYSSLAKLLCIIIDDWIGSCLKFLNRLNNDYQEIKEIFEINDRICKVDFLIPNLSDFHNGFESVFLLQFSNNKKIIYKPHDLGMEKTYYELLEWINEKLSFHHFKIIRILNNKTHGWVEYVEHQPCVNSSEVSNYYLQSGRILFVLYILNGRDFHFQNIIACKDQPVIIDLETLFHPELNNLNCNIVNKDLKISFKDSVLFTDFIPQNNFEYYNLDYDSSGLGGSKEQKTDVLIPDWNNINNDMMKSKYINYNLKPSGNTVIFENNVIKASDYIDRIITGFSEIYNFFMMHKKKILSNSGPLLKFKYHKSRVIFRATRIYSNIINDSLNPQYMRDGLSRSIYFEKLYARYLNNDTAHQWKKIINNEIPELEKLNIPYFLIQSDKKNSNCIKKSGFYISLSRIKKLSKIKLDEQINIIKKSFLNKI